MSFFPLLLLAVKRMRSLRNISDHVIKIAQQGQRKSDNQLPPQKISMMAYATRAEGWNRCDF